MNITIKKVAKVANVSITTVSRVSNGSKGVSAKTRLSKSIGIAVPDTIGDFYGEVIDGIESVATENEYNLIISLNHHIIKEELKAVNFFKAKKVDGAILVTTSGDDDYVNSLIDEGYNIVLLDRDLMA